MATKIFRGDSQPIAQVQTITIGGTPAAADVYSVLINRKVISYTVPAGSPTTSTVATGLLAALQSAGLAEFAEVVWSAVAAVITATAAQPGIPFTCTVAVTGSGTITLASASPVSSGPFHVNDTNNWNPATGNPGSADNVTIDINNGGALYGLSSFTASALGSLTVIRGSVGLPDLNQLGYQEYRTKVLPIAGGCSNVVIGNGVLGPNLCRLDFGASSTIQVNTGTTAVFTGSGQPVLLTNAAGTLTLTVDTGGVGLATGIGDVAAAGTVKVGTLAAPGSFGAADEEARLEIGSGATVTTLNQYGGTVQDSGTITTANINAGTFQANGTAAITTLNSTTNPDGNGPGVTIVWNSSGSMGTGTFDGPGIVLDLSGDVRAATGTLTFKRGAQLLDPNGRLAGVSVTFDRESLAVAVIASSTVAVTL